MEPPVLVTGGTGRIGRRVVPLLRAAGHDVRVLTRHPRPSTPGVEHVAGDTVAGRGVDRALEGVRVVLHLAGGTRGDDVAARHLASAARRAQVDHLVLVSVVGADAMPMGYFRAKAAAEAAVSASGVPWSVVRAAQLHDFVLPLARRLAASPVLPVPGGLRFEPVHVDEVAARLVAVALAPATGRAPDVVGPEVLDLAELVTAYRAAHDRPPQRWRLPVSLPGAAGRAYRAGANLAPAGTPRGTATWADFVSTAPTVPSSTR